MGNNIFGVKKLTPEVRETLKTDLISVVNKLTSELDEFVLRVELEMLQITLKVHSQEIHIGKFATGLRFLFDDNEVIFDTIEKYKEFTSHYDLKDDYGRSLSQEEFWEQVEACQGQKQRNWQDVTYSIDGYDFSTTTNFS